MIRKFGSVLFACCFTLAAASTARAQIVPGAPGVDWNRERQEYTADVLRAYDRLITEWRAAWTRGDVRGALELYDDDAMLFVGDTLPIQGKSKIEKQLHIMLPAMIEIRTGLSDFVASERLAYALGPFYLESRGADSKSRVTTGTVVTIIVRDGRRWKIRSQIFRPQAAATESP